jgi:aspartate/methionine/tyrosine aminotransferase
VAEDADPFPYMRWAKASLDPSDPLSLGLSGRPRPDPASLAHLEEAFRHPPPNARTAWREALAARFGVPVEGVHPALGASHANFLAYLAFARGGHVAAETPTYEAMLHLAGAVGAGLSTFARRFEDGWRLDASALGQAVRADTSLIAVTDPHNPSGARLTDAEYGLLVDAAEAVDAVLLVDEVYGELDPGRRTAALRHPRIVATASLTKTHGLPDLRAGWALGDRARVLRMDAWDDLVCPVLPPATMAMAAAHLAHADAPLAETIETAAARVALVDDWITGREDVAWRRPDVGFTGFVRLGPADRPLDGDRVASVAWERHGIRVVPGSFFQAPAWLRLSLLLPEATLVQALDGLGAALDAVAAEA